MKRIPWRELLPVLVLVVGAALTVALVKSRAKVEARPTPVVVPVVRVETVHPGDLQLVVASQGTVEPRTEVDLAPEVAGRIIAVAPSFVAGGAFAEGDVLITLDPRDSELQLARAGAALAQAQLKLERELAEAEIAKREWRELGAGAEASPLTLRVPQVAEARAALESVEAELAQARRDLARTRVRAPFAGRVRGRNADVGQFVGRGSPVARIYATDVAEVRLPLPVDELAYLDVALDFGDAGDGHGATEVRPAVELVASVAGATHRWRGALARSEGVVDPRSRMVTFVARVEDPYGRDRGSPPLAIGTFVEARIEGRRLRQVYVVPRIALRGASQVLVVNRKDQLELRDVEIVRAERERVILKGGLNDGDRVCISPLETVVEGMAVKVLEERAAGVAGKDQL